MIINIPLKILLLQADEKDLNDLVRMLLEINPKNKVHVANTMFEGLRIAQANDLDLILLDLNLQDNQAYKSFQKCREAIPQVPIIILASGGNEIIGAQAIRSGAQDYILKNGLDAKQLSRAIHYAKHRHDIHKELMDANKTLADHQRKLIQTQTISGLGTWEMDLLDQQIKGNARFFQLMGFTATIGSISRSTFYDLIYPEDRTKVIDYFNTLDPSAEVNSCDFRIVTAGTQIKHLRMSTRVQVDESAERLILLGIVQDITERQAIKTLYSEKLYLSKIMDLREKMLDDIAFYIRTPLFSIVNFIHLLEDHPVRNQHREAFTGLKASVDELQVYLNKLMNFSFVAREGASLIQKPFDLQYDLHMIRRILEYKTNDQNITFDVQIQSDLPKVVIGDASMIYRTLFNMQDFFKNIQAEKRKITFQIISDTNENGWFNLRIQCRDPYPYQQGFNPSNWLGKTMLANQYESLPENENLSRINMITLASLTEAMNGTYQITQLSGGALRILISIPLQVQAEEILMATNQNWIVPIRILLVEDHFLNQIATRNVVTSWSEHISVDIAENGLIAVEKFREYEYDLILMDIQMPVMNGIDASKKIREHSDVPIIAMSAHASESESRRCKDAGINEYLAKPFKPEELKNKVFKTVSVIR